MDTAHELITGVLAVNNINPEGTLSPIIIFFILFPAHIFQSIPPLWCPGNFNALTSSTAQRFYLGNILRK